VVTEQSFGQVEGHVAKAFVITGGEGLSIKVSDYGARLVEAHVPNADGSTVDVVLGFDDAAQYAASPAYFGATVGRYANRIRRGQFRLNGADYQVDCNEKANHLHGGHAGWDSRLWSSEIHPDGKGVTFRTTSADAEMGFPGACEVMTSYRLDGRDLRITMEATPDQDTLINMVHHSYFNLAGHGSGNVLHQHMRIPADFYLPVDDELLATGEVRGVAGTPFDFRTARPIGERMADLPPTGSAIFDGGSGYDHNWCLRGDERIGEPALIEGLDVFDPVSGRRLRMWTTEPGLQMYTGGYLSEEVVGKGGLPYCQYAGFTLETQKFPDSPRFRHFPSSVVRAGERYRQEKVLEFSTA
jgi:aldose 1-epimerase